MQHDTMAVPAVGGPATGPTTSPTTGAPADAGDIVILSDATFDFFRDGEAVAESRLAAQLDALV